MTKPSSQLWQTGIELFNAGEFFQCHEVLEELWNQQSEPEKQLTQGILQIAVGYLHLGRNNRIGALKLMRKGLIRLEPFLPQAEGLCLERLVAAVLQTVQSIESESENIPGPPQIERSVNYS